MEYRLHIVGRAASIVSSFFFILLDISQGGGERIYVSRWDGVGGILGDRGNKMLYSSGLKTHFKDD